MTITTTTVTGNLANAALMPDGGEVLFCPATGLTDAGGNPTVCSITDANGLTVITMNPVPAELNLGQFSISVVPTDTAGLSPSGWFYQITVNVPNLPAYSSYYFIPSSPSPVDLSELTPLIEPTAANLTAFLPLTGGTETGPVTLAGSPPLKVPGATNGQVLTSDGSGNITPQAVPGDKNYTQAFTNVSSVTVAHNLGKYPAVTVMDSTGDTVWADPLYADLDHVTISFSAPFSGTVACN